MKGRNMPSEQQRVERHYFEMFRKTYSLPPGIITYGDKPDVVVNGPAKLGIEMTRFYVTVGASPNSEQAQQRLREIAVAQGDQLYQQNGGKNIGLTVGFDKTHPIQKTVDLAQRFAALAQRVADGNSGKISRDLLRDVPEVGFAYLHACELQYSSEPDPLFPDGQPDLSEGFAAFKEYEDRRDLRALRDGIYKPLQRPMKWKVMQVHSPGFTSPVRLTEIIREKEAKARQYVKCDAYWLLIVVDFLDRAQDQEVRIEGFTIDSEVFQKIIIYKPYFEQIVEITPQPVSVQSG
jgi:hypothetical protein